MKITYVDEYETEYVYSGTSAPRINEKVIINGESYFVIDLQWFPAQDAVEIFISQTQQSAKIVVAPQVASGLKEAKIADKKATEALKETAELKRQVFSVRQHLKINRNTKE